MLTDQQIERYSRQLLLPEVSGRKQLRLLASAVLVAGTGAVAETVVGYLSRAGIGQIDAGEGLHPTSNPDTKVRRGVTLGESLSRVNAVVLTRPVSESEAEQVLASHIPAWVVETSNRRILGPVKGASCWCASCVAHATQTDRSIAEVEADDLIGASLTALAVLRELLGLPSADPRYCGGLESDEWTSVPEVEGCQHYRTSKPAE